MMTVVDSNIIMIDTAVTQLASGMDYKEFFFR